MNLKAREKSALLAGKFPEIVREQPTMTLGEEIVLKTTKTENGPIPEVTITILGRHKRKNGAWEAIYKVKDDRGLYVDVNLGYTRSPARALDKDAPILDPNVIEAYAAEAEHKTAFAGASHRYEEDITRLEAKRDEAIRLNKPGRVKVLETKIARKRVRAKADTSGEPSTIAVSS